MKVGSSHETENPLHTYQLNLLRGYMIIRIIIYIEKHSKKTHWSCPLKNTINEQTLIISIRSMKYYYPRPSLLCTQGIHTHCFTKLHLIITNAPLKLQNIPAKQIKFSILTPKSFWILVHQWL